MKKKYETPSQSGTWIAEETPIIPEMVAERIAEGDVFLTTHLTERAEYHYTHKEHFNKSVRRAKGMEFLEAFMEHWKDAYLKNPERYVAECGKSVFI